MAKCLRDNDLLADAHAAAKLFSDDLIEADKRLDVVAGSAGGILGLLRLHRDSPSNDVLASAAKCGDHLLAQPRRGENGGSWVGQGFGEQALNGMSHGAAGFAYALACLAAATGRDEFATRRPDASRSKMQVMIRNATTGRISGAMRDGCGRASGVTAPRA